MELQDLLLFIEQYGYFALFFSLWLGIIGMPLPDEMIVMSGGFLSSLGKLVIWKSFLLTYLGVVSGLSLGFILGKLFGHRVLDKLVKKKKAKYLSKSKELLDQYGRFALVLSYFIPIVRHILPYLVGMNNMPFKTYALFSYTTGFVWTLIYFTLGLLFGSQIEYISVIATKYGIYFGLFIVTVSCIYYFYIRKFKK
ncbi:MULTISPECIES: DedA family protein [Lysinibacillus]|uniref:DedA family protein n=1 Tax=Lysinibacillus TaxID=400634 RepID=UPI001C8B588B|nr:MULTISPECIES: DedA family protein [Lysinibacillus]WHP43712.1 DedA family protein [Lysinibacillus boronitolerans]MBX8943893.1 DedA family protein [Lysinibacillus sp. K60]UNT54379.1 DedA family protein [Lysinibacillus capsici]UUV25738.1 DedA family protein [Lysinibacillus sp. FN11]UYB48613.1 DedA family protein [Lysinibacillus capsici]